MLAPTKCPNNLDIAWAIGIYEGEGSISSNGNLTRKGEPSLNISVWQTDTHILYRLREFFGGNVYPASPSESQLGPQTSSRWQLSGDRAREFARMLYHSPWLSPRRKLQILSTGLTDLSESVETSTPETDTSVKIQSEHHG